MNRAVLKIMGGKHSVPMMTAMSTMLSEGIVDFVKNKRITKPTFNVIQPQFDGFVLMCLLLDEIQKTIPVVSQIHIQCDQVNRDEFMEFLGEFNRA